MPPAPGDYEISVEFKGTFGGVAGPVRGSPVTATFQKGQPAENNTMPGPAMIKETIADVNTLLQFATKVSQSPVAPSSTRGSRSACISVHGTFVQIL